jgi:hypothetical protein
LGLGVIEVNPDPAPSDEQNLLSQYDAPFDASVTMGRDLGTCRMGQEPQLLRKVVWTEKLAGLQREI